MQKKKVRNWKSILGTIAVIAAFGTIITACVYSIVTRAGEEQRADDTFRCIEKSVEKPNPLILSDDGDEDAEIEGMAVGNKFVYYQPHSVAELLEMNNECFGWISIAGTNTSYPVMHTPSNPEKYLYKDFYGNYSYSGTPFLDARCSENDDNLIIYGHHMNGGTMFADLCNYTSKDYRDSHPNVFLETRSGASLYRVFAVMKMKSTDYWYNFLTAETERKYDTKMSYALEHSLYNTGIIPKYRQQILTLSTCYGSAKNDRIIVLAVKG
ncbi:class B sortase [Ruminococcus sp. zg-924]|uniref:class B sortase n=1 Tax=Ruminococcus sp. zg-924 TaxID=2678505 RepID=UPI0021090BF4|nr:class B sortase [Ruminococcus sp. zg-924]MCQ4022851.1 sortase [Ruminococcus sp. zg-924]